MKKYLIAPLIAVALIAVAMPAAAVLGGAAKPAQPTEVSGITATWDGQSLELKVVGTTMGYCEPSKEVLVSSNIRGWSKNPAYAMDLPVFPKIGDDYVLTSRKKVDSVTFAVWCNPGSEYGQVWLGDVISSFDKAAYIGFTLEGAGEGDKGTNIVVPVKDLTKQASAAPATGQTN